MIFSATGIVVDHYGDVLLIKRDDTRTLAPPGGAANIGELPPDTVEREVREETGLIVMAVRLVGLYYLPTQPNDFLTLCFRCIMRGGEITTSEESLRVGFFKTNPLPKPMLDLHQERIQRSLAHQGGPPYWGSNTLSSRLRLGNSLMNRVIYPWLHFRRRRACQPPYEPPLGWQARSAVIIRNNQGQVLWTRDQDDHGQTWMLPGGTSEAKEPPWNTAVRSVQTSIGIRAKLSGLSGVYPAPDKPEMTFSFTANSVDNSSLSPSGEIAYFAPGHEPVEAQPQHLSFVIDALVPDEDISFRLMDPLPAKTISSHK
jgi:ADP-ribose pyrophosphatase YjhB (NUDIX family)